MKKILFVTADMPTDLRSGYKIRVFNILTKLSELFNIEVIHVGDSEINPQHSLVSLSSYKFVQARSKNGCTMLKSYLSNTPFLAYRFSPSELSDVMQKALAAGDVGGVYFNMTIFDVDIPEHIPVYIDQHDIISHTSREGAQGASSFVRRLVYKVEVIRWEKFEVYFYKKFKREALTVLSVKGSDQLETSEKCGVERCFTVVNGHNVSALPVQGKWKPELLFIGTSHERNVTALKKLYFEVLPALRRSAPELKLRVVGAFEAADLSFIDARSNNISLHTYVDDISDYYSYGSVQVLPFTMGAGSKLKVFESFAHGVPVVGTSLAFTGIPSDAIENEVCSDDAEEIAKMVLAITGNKQVYDSLSNKLIDISRDFHWDNILKDDGWIYDKQ